MCYGGGVKVLARAYGLLCIHDAQANAVPRRHPRRRPPSDANSREFESIPQKELKRWAPTPHNFHHARPSSRPIRSQAARYKEQYTNPENDIDVCPLGKLFLPCCTTSSSPEHRGTPALAHA